ncbi:MAG: hypothetical protein E6J29_02475 [Chloroflexi bacterium]|nr:MAG: hypothetical protein E6J29_02475 [Chloroflexota bacterium]
MKLLRLAMIGFRSYSELAEVVFEPGVNVFLGRNEAGKSSILLAIQAALYPPRLATEREPLVSEGSDRCQVALEYSLPGGRMFRVERDLVAGKGSIAECREGTWHLLATAPGDVAKLVREHTGCDEPLFRASLLVRHEGVEVGDGSDLVNSLNERLEVLVSGSPGGVSAAKAVNKLETRVKELSGPRAGLVVAAEAKLREARETLERARAGGRRLEAARPLLAAAAERAGALEGELAEAQAVLERARRVAALERRLADATAARAATGLGAGAVVAGIVVAWLWSVPAGAVLAVLGAVFVAFSWFRRAQPAAPGPDLAELTAERAARGRDLAELEAELEQAAPHRLDPAELARLDARAARLPAELKEAQRTQMRMEVELQALESSDLSLSELEDEVEVASSELARLKRKLEAMRLAQEELRAAIEDIRSGVGPQLAAEATRALRGVAPGYAVALADAPGLAFRPAWADGEPLGRRELSDGTLDQFYFAVRVALADVLLGDLRPPLLLDDPFRYADEERRRSLHLMLAEIAEARQVIYFTIEEPTGLQVTHRLPAHASGVVAE